MIHQEGLLFGSQVQILGGLDTHDRLKLKVITTLLNKSAHAIIIHISIQYLLHLHIISIWRLIILFLPEWQNRREIYFIRLSLNFDIVRYISLATAYTWRLQLFAKFSIWNILWAFNDPRCPIRLMNWHFWGKIIFKWWFHSF